MNPKSNPFSAAGSGLIRGGLGAYGEKIFGSGSEYVQSNVSTFIPVDILLDRQVGIANKELQSSIVLMTLSCNDPSILVFLSA